MFAAAGLKVDRVAWPASGLWELYLPLENKRVGLGNKAAACPAELYDLVTDVAESQNVADEHPEVVARLTALAERAREDLGDHDRLGSGQRPAGWIDDPRPPRLA